MINKTVLSMMVSLCAMAGAAQASNVDVINFFHKEDVSISGGDGNAFTEARNAYQNLNARDRMIADAIAAQTGRTGIHSDISANVNPANVPAGWKESLTKEDIASMSRHSLPPAPQTSLQQKINAMPLTKGEAGKVINSVKDDVTRLNARADRIYQTAADAEVHAENAQDTANHAQSLAVAANKVNFAQSTIIAQNKTTAEHAEKLATINAKTNFAQSNIISQVKTTQATDEQRIANNESGLSAHTDSIAQNKNNIVAVTDTAKRNSLDVSALKQSVVSHGDRMNDIQAQVDGKVDQTTYSADKAAANDSVRLSRMNAAAQNAATKVALDATAQNRETLEGMQKAEDIRNSDRNQSMKVTAKSATTEKVDEHTEREHADVRKPDNTAVYALQAKEDAQIRREETARQSGDTAVYQSAKNYTDERIKSVEDRQSQDRKEYRAGIAGAVAISGLHYVETDNAVAVGAGSFKDAQGYAIGYRHKFSGNVASTVAASETSNGDAMFSASASIGW